MAALTSGRDRRRKIVVLGGGIASLAAVFELTDRADWQNEFEIDLYQMGWRLGGKGASSRNLEANDRIEEHGLHIWMGFYHNAFALIRRCYDELARPTGSPLVTWQDAFMPQNVVAWQECVDGKYRAWCGSLAPNGGVPGDGRSPASPSEYLRALIPGMVRAWHHMEPSPNASSLIRRVAREALLAAAQLGQKSLAAVRLARSAVRVVEERVERDDGLRRAWIGCDLLCTFAIGMVRDGVLSNGFDAIDHFDFRDWLRRHGATDLTLRSGLVRALYDFVFAYVDGDPDRPSIGAGTILRVTLRMLFGYSGSIFYRMRGGMGEVVFAPLYEVLRRRGVRFHFFSPVRRLEVSADGRSIARVYIGRQATTKQGSYEPLIDVRGLPAWPTAPLHEQLVEGRELLDGNINLEASSEWTDRSQTTLERGRDFDTVVLGVPVAALPPICSELAGRRREWAAMLSCLPTVRTQAAQLWMTRDLEALGWPHASPISTAHAAPHSTWADFSHLLSIESWPQSTGPRSLAYLCGPLPETSPTSNDHVHDELSAWLERHSTDLWPNFSPDDLVGGFENQYVRVNVAPSERYVLSLPGTLQYRLRADQSGFENLVLAGDWLRTGLNLGCIESAVISGLQAARALSRRPRKIFGETDFE